LALDEEEIMANSITVAQMETNWAQRSNTWEAEALGFLALVEEAATTLVDVELPNVPSDTPSTPFENFLWGRILNEPEPQAGSSFTAPSSDPGTSTSTTVVSPPTLVDIPDDTTSPPVLDLPARPDLETPTAPESAPVIEDIALPTTPNIELPTAPVLPAVAFPDAPTLTIPTFSEVAPDIPTSFLQTRTFEYEDEYHDRTLLDDIRNKMITDVADGSYGIESSDEDALWSRARDREMAQLEGEETETEELYAARGYSLPPGAMHAALTRVRSAAEERLSELERDIAIKRSELFRDTRQFTFQQGTNLENIRMQHYGFAMERALNAQRYAAEFAINIHDAQIRLFNASLQRYATISSVFRERIQAAIAQIQIYEAEVRAAVSRQEANRIDVELYQALIAAANSRIQLYETEVRTATVIAELQRLKVDTYRAEIQAFATRVQANESQVGVYEASIRGEQAKTDIYRSDVAAYGERVRAAGIEQSARNERARVLIQQKQTEVDEYRALLARHQTLVDTENKRVAVVTDRYRSDILRFDSAVKGYDALAKIDLTESDFQVRAIQEQTRRLQENVKLAIQASNDTLDRRLTAANAGAKIAGDVQMAAASTVASLALESTDTTA
jgi:hypothetical protein